MEKDRFKRHISVESRGRSIDGFKRASDSKYAVTRRNFFEVYKTEYSPSLETTSVNVTAKQTATETTVAPVIERPIVFKESVAQEADDQTYPERRPLIDLELPGGPSSTRSRLKLKKPLMPAIRLWAFRTSSVAIVLTLIVGGLLFSQSYLTLHKVLKGGSKSVASLQTNVNPSLLKGEGDGRINILLLGRGGGNHDGPDLTDTMMLASIDPVNHNIGLVSIPRDIWVDVPNQGAMKINAAWESGEFVYEGKIAPGSTNPNAIAAGYSEVDQVVEKVLGVTINYNMIADFQAFQQAVDNIGGVTINVPTQLYDPTMAWENNYNPILAQPGWQTFTGAQALNYVRSRETTSDFARGQRQRATLVAIKQKAETLGVVSNPLKIAGLFSTLGNNVATDISLSDANRLYDIVKNINSTSVTSIGLADAPNNYIKTEMLGGQSIDIPSAGMSNYSAIQNYIRSQLVDPYIVREKAPILILNGTTEPGLAASTEATLKSYGYNIVGAENAPSSNYNQTMVIDLSKGKDKFTAHYLDQRFNTSSLTGLPDNSIQTNGAAFVIIIGNDATVNSQG